MTPNIRRVLVTGAAGSIGAEVCRVLVDAGVKVIGLDIAETPLFWLGKELQGAGDFIPAIGSVSDRHLMQHIMRHHPQVVVHAAALKHVEMCERNVCEAVKVNIGGTMVVASEADRAGARMVLVSTDKAVHPTSVMGATKAVAERLLWGARDSRIVRLVNIWDSAGSLAHVVRDQIAKGGPVTLTDADMERMFMSIGAAARLIGDAVFSGEEAKGSVLMVPTEYERRKISDVINQLIAESGRKDITVEEIGRFHGEKLSEELTEILEHKYHDERMPWAWRLAVKLLVNMTNERRVSPVRTGLFNLLEARK